jgi:mRNA-degrading endonuclease RelE of RelBE toxin-antitoxin system
MMLRYTAMALDQIDQLPAQVRSRLLKKVHFYVQQDDPIHFAKHLTGTTMFRFRVGDYRAVFEIQSNTIVVLLVDKRSDVYRSI